MSGPPFPKHSGGPVQLGRLNSQKNGKRLRYYVSRRLVTDRSRKHPDAWRLPAEQLEGLLAQTVMQHLERSGAAALKTTGLQASDLFAVEAALRKTLTPRKSLALIERADIGPGALRVGLDAQILAGALDIAPASLNSEELSIEAQFQMRRRGVELKLHLGVAPPETDPVLIQNIVKARNWLAKIIEGKSFADIAETEDTSKRRIQAVVELALLSPDVLGAIVKGEQPVGLTSDYLIKTGFSVIWSEQHEQFAKL